MLSAMKLVYRYLLRLHVAPFLFAALGLTLLLLLDQVSKRFEHLIGKDLHWAIIAEIFVYSIPFIIAQTLPMAVLIAVLYVFSRLVSNFEICAFWAGGISTLRAIAPVMGAAVVLAGALMWFNDTILPHSNHHLQVLLTGVARTSPTFNLEAGTLNVVLPSQVYLEAGAIDRNSNVLEDVAVYDERDGMESRTIFADRGTVSFAENREDLVMELEDGILQVRRNDGPHELRQVEFTSMLMEVSGVADTLERNSETAIRGDREMTIAQMREVARSGRESARNAQLESRAYAMAVTRELLGRPPPSETANSEEPSVRSAEEAAVRFQRPVHAADQFSSYADMERRGIRRDRRHWVEIHKKVSLPFACIVFVLVGIPIALRYPQAGVALVVGVSLAFFTAYYVFLVTGEDLADRLWASPMLAMWMPNILFGAFGTTALIRSRRATR